MVAILDMQYQYGEQTPYIGSSWTSLVAVQNRVGPNSST